MVFGYFWNQHFLTLKVNTIRLLQQQSFLPDSVTISERGAIEVEDLGNGNWKQHGRFG